MLLKDLLTKESWTQGTWGKDSKGNVVDLSKIDTATSFCIAGAILYCYRDENTYHQLLGKIRAKVKKDPMKWNDSATWEEVESVIKDLE